MSIHIIHEEDRTMNITDFLTRTKKLISHPDQWTQRGVMAVDRFGYSINPGSPRACKWCVMGAMERVAVNEGMEEEDAILIISSAREAMHMRLDERDGNDDFRNLAEWNDRSPHHMIIQMLDEVIDASRQERIA